MIAAPLPGIWAGLSTNVRGALTVSLGALLPVTMTPMVKTLGATLHCFEIVFLRGALRRPAPGLRDPLRDPSL